MDGSGFLYEFTGGHRLLHGDAFNPESYRDLLEGERASMVFTDPPYDLYRYDYIPLLFRNLKSNGQVFIMGSDRQVKEITLQYPQLVQGYYTVVFRSGYKRLGQHHLNAAIIIHLAVEPVNPYKPVMRAVVADRMRLAHHRHAKPTRILDQFIEAYTRPGDLVLDPFAGTGTTLLAAGMKDRKAAVMDNKLENMVLIRENALMMGIR